MLFRAAEYTACQQVEDRPTPCIGRDLCALTGCVCHLRSTTLENPDPEFKPSTVQFALVRGKQNGKNRSSDGNNPAIMGSDRQILTLPAY